MNSKPYISFIIAGRNDDYGGDFNYRLNNSINNLGYFTEKYQLPAEYIVVNYNPVPDKPSLREAIDWPKNRKFLKIRIITVPKTIHDSLENPAIRDTVPLYEYIAKNTGIRRAKGEFICGANPDIIYGSKLVKYLSKRSLKKDTYYRVDRCDFNRFEMNGVTQENLERILQPKTFRVFLMGNTWMKEFPNFFWIRLWDLRRKNLQKLICENRKWVPRGPEYFYHCNCSGDFMMMHRDLWTKLDGHPEKTLVAAHTDALFVIMCAAEGIKEKSLPWPVFHQNHDRRYDCEGKEVKPSVRLMYERFLEMGNKMLDAGKSFNDNDPNWGLLDHQLEEQEF